MFTFIVQCNDSDIDIIATCGMGATSCVGTMRNPVCECNHTMHYVAADDRKSCLLGRNIIRCKIFTEWTITKRTIKSFTLFNCSSVLES